VSKIETIDALVADIGKDEIGRVPPARRQRLAQALRQVAEMLDAPRPEAPVLGLLRDLRDGRSAN
jgi:hypothetical protein